jgi:DNA (cytosine-5)-methyltransferase 1
MADGSTIGVRAGTRRKLIADLWCGAGGTITGAQRAAKQMGMPIEVVSVNHWPTAIETHSRYYPDFRHHCADLESARPLELVPEGYLDALIASPTCTFHSRARGGKPVTDQQRMDPWHVVRWCTELRVKRIQIEYVPEFVDWGPCSLVTGRPIPSRKGEYFRAWCDALRAIGFKIDYRVLCCADYGDATTRNRFFMIGRSDGKRLRWPDPTHAKHGASDLLGSRARWRGAAEIIDWDTPGKSIFTRKKPLAPNTLRRIRAGAVRYGWPQPYIDALDALLEGREPVLDIQFHDYTDWVTACASQGLSAPIGGIVMSTASGGAARDLSQPVPTVTTGGNGATPHYVTPLLMGVNGTAPAKPVEEPVPTITTGGASAMKHPGNARPQLLQPLLVSKHGGPHNSARATEEPMWSPDTAGAGSLAAPVLAPYYGSGSGETAQSVHQPVPAITTKARFGLADPVVIRTDQTGSGATGVRSAADPVHTLVSKANVGMSQPILMRAGHGDSDGRDPASRLVHPEAPVPALTGSNELSLAQPFLVPNFGERPEQEPRTHGLAEPLPTITASGHIQLAQPATHGYRIDILYRMLHYRELARAMSFDDGEDVYDFAGTSTEITKQIGNAVPCRTAAALFRALMED